MRIDLYGLIAAGTPLDEFDSEIDAIVKQLSRCKTVKDLSHVIARVLGSSFGEHFNPERFEDEAIRIFGQLGWA